MHEASRRDGRWALYLEQAAVPGNIVQAGVNILRPRAEDQQPALLVRDRHSGVDLRKVLERD